MKKTLLAVALIAFYNTLNAQAVLGTRDCGNSTGNRIEFITKDVSRAWWHENGTLDFGSSTDPYSGYGRKVVLDQTDLYVKSGSDIFLDESSTIYGGYAAAYRNTKQSYIQVNTGGDNSMILNSASHHIFLQVDSVGAIVAVGKKYQTPGTLTGNSMLVVNGVTNSLGYVAKIDTVKYTGTVLGNKQTTALVTTSGINIVLPDPAAGIDEGHIYVVKNISGGAVTVSVDNLGKIDGVSSYTLSATNSSIIVQSIGPDYIIIGSH